MEISILLTLLLMIILLGRLFFQAGKICLISEEQIYLDSCLSHRAVKFIMRGLYLLNTVALPCTQKVAQTTLIQLHNLKLEG